MLDRNLNDRPAAKIFDPIEMEVFANHLLSITEDMGNMLIRGSFSTNIKERKDCSVALFDGRGRLVAQASHIPMHLGSLSGGVRTVLANYSRAEIAEGDAFICNDAYMAGGTHASDITVVTPIFIDGEIRFFAANIGHHSDVGGPFPSSMSPAARSVFDEGIRLPIIRIVRAGRIDTDLLRLIAHNTREPLDRELDLRVQIATNDRGGKLVRELASRLGLEQIHRSIEDLLTYTDQRLRNRITALPNGVSSFTTYLDDDGIGTEQVPVVATVTVAGDVLKVDFTGSGPQARGGGNLPWSALEASVYTAVKTMLDPELLPNEGMMGAIEITAPKGTITNPEFPAAVNNRAFTAQKVSGALIGAFSGLLPPETAMASSNDSIPAMVFYGKRRGGRGDFVYFETIAGGSGALADRDGMDGVHVHITNTSNLPAEALENEYPLMVEEYALVPGSGGRGKYRGGLAIARQIRSLQDGMFCHVATDNSRRGAEGLRGGGFGGLSRIIFNHGRPDERPAGSNSISVTLAAGESVRLETAGGGGFGDLAERDPALTELDRNSGKMPAEASDQ